MRPRFALIVSVTLLAAACSGAGRAAPLTTSPSGSGTTTGPPTVVDDDGSTNTTPPTRPSTTAPPTTSPGTDSETSTTTSQIAGSPGFGDPYFPDLGNGGYDVEHYLLDLAVDPEEGSLTGLATITATTTAESPLGSFNLDLAGLEVTSVSLEGVPAAFSRDGFELTITPEAPLPPGETFQVTVAYEGVPDQSLVDDMGIGVGWNVGSDGLFAIGEPDGARTWFPCNDHPGDKASFTVRVTVPEPWVAAAPGVLAATETGPGRTTFVWDLRQPTATYLATVVVGDLVRIDRAAHDDVILRDYLPSDLIDRPPAAFEMIPDVLDLFESAFGPYPFDAYGHVVVTGFPGALENPTLTIFGRSALAPFTLDGIVVHELAHMWFGDSVTPATWQDIWLNEGFATFAEWMWLEETAGRSAYEAEVRDSYAFMDAGRHPVPGDPGIPGLFSDSVYVRGGLTLAALRAEIGDDAFYESLRAYAGRFEHSNASTADFVAVVGEVSGVDVTDLIDSWLFDTRMPPLPEL